MRKWNYLLCCLCIFGTTAFGGLQPGTCDIKFLGTSTLHDFHGSVSSAPFEWHIEEVGQTHYSVSGRITAAVAEMDAGNKKRDKKMRIMFEETQFPLITVDLEKLAMPVPPRAGLQFIREVNLTIRDKKLTQSVAVSNYSATEESVMFEVAFSVGLSEFGLKAPGVMGLIKVGDVVEVTAMVTLDLRGFKKDDH